MRFLVPLRAFEHEALPVIATDPEGRIRFCNLAATRLVALGHRILGEPCWATLGLRREDGSVFCGPDCPIQAAARAGVTPTPQRVLLDHRARRSLEADLLTFLVPGERAAGRQSVLHILSRVAPSPSRPGEFAGPRADLPALPFHVLTAREFAVLSHLAEGLDTRGIAVRLGIRPATVRNHVQNTLRKLGLHRRLPAVIALLRTRAARTRRRVPRRGGD